MRIVSKGRTPDVGPPPKYIGAIGIQAQSRVSGADFGASRERQETRDQELQRYAATRNWIFGYDAEAEALAASAPAHV